jgi:quercetin dioxygenase-like cupin family protein
MHTNSQAHIVLSTADLNADMEFLINLGFRLDQIFPADDPAVAILSGYGLQLRLDKTATVSPATLHLLADKPESIHLTKREFTAPNGTRFIIFPLSPALNIPATVHGFEVRSMQDSDSWVIGRAGMLYRDLLPNRLGGSMIASHIRIPKGGPVPDQVHFHTVGFQLIYCLKGWVKLVYEGQGPPFVLQAGDCVTQPPEIRHQVLEASDGLEVIEIGVPADHITTMDHEMQLPTKDFYPDREYQGQRFCRHHGREAVWKPWRIDGFEVRDTGVGEATEGMATVEVARLTDAKQLPRSMKHDKDIFSLIWFGEILNCRWKGKVSMSCRRTMLL